MPRMNSEISHAMSDAAVLALWREHALRAALAEHDRRHRFVVATRAKLDPEIRAKLDPEIRAKPQDLREGRFRSVAKPG